MGILKQMTLEEEASMLSDSGNAGVVYQRYHQKSIKTRAIAILHETKTTDVACEKQQ